MTDTLLIDGVEFPPHGCLTWPYEWAYLNADIRSEPVAYPGIDGSFAEDAPFDSRVLPVGLSIKGACVGKTRAERMAQANLYWREVLRAAKPGREVTLTRRMSFPVGDGTYTFEDHTARARLLHLLTSRAEVDIYESVAEFVMLDGLWYGPEVSKALDGSPLVTTGDTRTHRMSISITGGTDVTLTNETNGYSLTYSGSNVGTTLTLDVENMRVIAGSVDRVTWNKRLPFRLEAGSNVLTVTGGGVVTIEYNPAYM